jgi:hypothetical protein
MFGLDWRSLALMRMALATVLLCDLWISARSLRAFYTDDGVLPRSLLRAYAPPDFSLHLLGGSVEFEAALFALEAVFAVMLLVGYRTRLATFGCWVLLLSRQARNPLVLFGADMIELLVLFWALLLPLNRRYSIDAALGRVPPPTAPNYLGVAGVGAIIQFIIIYVMSGLMKTGASWHIDHSAVSYSLSLDMYSRPLGQWLNQYDFITELLTIYTVYLELYGPLLLISPIASGWLRLLGCLLLGTLQLGFGVCMQMGLFWVATNVFLLMFLPAEFWTRLAEPFGRWLAKKLNFPAPRQLHPVQTIVNPPPASGRPWRWLRDGAILLVLAGVIEMNIGSLPGHSNLLPPLELRALNDLGLSQAYGMFAPDPQADDGWFVFRGWEKNGATVNLLSGASPATLDKPADIPATYIDQRWGSLFFDLLYPDYAKYLESIANYFDAQWEQTHSGGERLQRVEIIFIYQANGPHHTKTDPVPMTFWTEYY